ncbi:O-antigen ligase family protein [Paenibacillus sp. LHD-38]|uniref:O-antigen ligase family protein n=1 Tax=Paenibacillus sp. LHD-38 TaxID=3072143 RepID=UPI00280DE39D|nr:O-antigen ligase family protein [Paenibacillus sp. LHD-38]MDQ8737000.1 O-antigen ligase family protein [Paenibacillus sp. LHD-38]
MVIRNLVIALFMLSLMLLTYDSLPYIPFSVYRPVSMFPMFLASVLLLFTDFRFKKGDAFFLIFVMYSIGHSLLVATRNGDIASSASHIITLLFGLSMYRVTVYVAEQAKEDPEIRSGIAKSIAIAFIPPLAAGFLQLVDAFFIRNGFSGAFTGLFADKVYLRRIQMLSGEPSWAAIHMLSGGLIMFFLYKQGFRKQMHLLIAVVLLMVLSFSAYAYTVLLTALVIYVLVTNKNRGRMLVVLSVCAFVVVVGVPYLIETFKVSGYFTQRFQFDFKQLINNDNSFFIRLVFPAIGFLEFARHPIFGVGGGFYYTEFASLLQQYFSSGLKFSEVHDLVFINPYDATSRNMVSKVFAEEGLIGVILFGGFLVSIFRSCGANSYSKFAFALCIALVMNFDSYAFLDFWLLFGFIRGGGFETEAIRTGMPVRMPVRGKGPIIPARPIYSEWRRKA